MDIERHRSYCIAKNGVTEEMPFGPDTLVCKVMGKIFAISPIEPFTSVSLKVDPETGVDLRERYEAVKPGYHLNKKHWITVTLDGSVPDKILLQWIDNSYNLVVASLTKKQKTALESM